MIDPSAGPCLNDVATSNVDELEENCSTITNEATETEASGEEVLSPIVDQRGNSS